MIRFRRALLSIVTTALLLVSMVFGGTTFRWCLPMHQPMKSCCCHSSPREAVAEVPSHHASQVARLSPSNEGAPVASAPCCEVRAIEGLAAARAAEPSGALDLPTVTIVGPAAVAATPRRAPSHAAVALLPSAPPVEAAHARPPEAPHRRNCVWLV